MSEYPVTAHTPNGWPLVTQSDYLRILPTYTAELAAKLDNSDADVAAAINAASQAVAAAATAQTAAAALTLTPWAAHGGTVAAGISIAIPFQWSRLGNVVFWRGEPYKSGGFAIGTPITILSGLPAHLRPAVDAPLAVYAGDPGAISAWVTTTGELRIYVRTGSAGSYPLIGGSYLTPTTG